MNNTKYIIIGIFLLTNSLSVVTTLYLTSHKPNRELDIEVVAKVLEGADKYCKEMKARKYIVRASGLVVDAGCSKK